MPKFTPISVHDLGEYLREQRTSAQLSLRQLSAVAGISNPYISQIERGLKKPSAEILQALAKALRISAESLYVRAGILEEHTDHGGASDVDVTAAILAEPRLNDRQRAVLLDVYESFIIDPSPKKAAKPSRPSAASAAPTSRGSNKPEGSTPTPGPKSAPTSKSAPKPGSAPRASSAPKPDSDPKPSSAPRLLATSKPNRAPLPNTKENQS